MQMAQGLLQQGGLDADRAAAALTSISFDMYRYKEPAFYTPETMASIVDSFHRAGWKHLVNGNQAPANEAQPRTAITDVWLHFTGADIDHVTVLVRGVARHEPGPGGRRSAAAGPDPPERALRDSQGRPERGDGARAGRPLALRAVLDASRESTSCRPGRLA